MHVWLVVLLISFWMACTTRDVKIDIERYYDEACVRLRNNHEGTYRTNFMATYITLAFIWYDRIPDVESATYKEQVAHAYDKWSRKAIIYRTGEIEHVEIWFPINKTAGLACSTTVNNGVYLKPRTFTDEGYCFYEIQVSEYEHDRMLVDAYDKQCRHGFDTNTMVCLMLPMCCTYLRDMCRAPNAPRKWICSDLVFSILTEGGVLTREEPILTSRAYASKIPPDDMLFSIPPSRVTTTLLHDTLLKYGVMTQCQNKAKPFRSKVPMQSRRMDFDFSVSALM